ncbi:hypothetical protein LB535_28635 [Mesorhizobium sp. CA10]|nr:hypothetical protein [Mesorhizobium sp. CA10]MBZ9886306.1 hypothetical protein [Mesorhizobium sp. CA10]
MMPRNFIFALVAMIDWLLCASAMADDADFTETRQFLHVVIGGKLYHLDSLVVKAVGTKGPLPVALITGGTGHSGAEVKGERAENYAPQARDLALRGWLTVVVIRRVSASRTARGTPIFSMTEEPAWPPIAVWKCPDAIRQETPIAASSWKTIAGWGR